MNFITFFGNYQLLFVIQSTALIFKASILYFLLSKGLHELKSKQKKSFYLLLLILFGSILDDFSWIVKLGHLLFIPQLPYSYVALLIRIGWVFTLVTWQSLGLFLESLVDPDKKTGLHQKIFFICSCSIILYYLKFIIGDFTITNPKAKSLAEFQLMSLSVLYCIISIIPSVIIVFKKLKTSIPRIIKKQTHIFMQTIIFPLTLTELYYFLNTAYMPNVITASYAITAMTTILTTYAIYYCARKVANIRFLNIGNHVHEAQKLSLVENFKEILDQLNNIESSPELTNLTKTFFKQAFNIPMGRTQVFFRISHQPTEYLSIPPYVEHFIAQESFASELLPFLLKKKILIYDELEFSNFYERTEIIDKFLIFMRQLNADLFVPIYDHTKIIGYIIVERDARINELYSDLERDEIVVFASFAANIIHLLQNHKIENILSCKQTLKEELYQKHQEINQYKESLHLFLEQSEDKKIGIMFYKNRNFVFANQDAKDLIIINPSTQDGHPLTQELKKLVKNVLLYQTAQNCCTYNEKGKRLVINAIPNLDSNTIIITIYPPHISDIIQKQLTNLKDPSEWDYLLYLETTNAGHLINQAIPGSGKTLLNVKIKLLKCALSKKTLLLKGPEDDLISTVELIHHISMRENLIILKLENINKDEQLAVKLFGINSLFGSNINQPLFEKFNNNGTLYIQNINLMDLETQKYLADYLEYGYYRPYKSEHYIKSDVRIICSTHQDLLQLVQEQKFLPELFERLQQTSVTLPSLLNLNDEELYELADLLTTQNIQDEGAKKILALTSNEKNTLINKNSVSLKKFKEYVHHVLKQKSKKNNITQTTLNPAYQLTDPELIKAARLGKHALRDPQIMALLWKKFKNQNKIATFLGVNRSSINRRCKEYSLH